MGKRVVILILMLSLLISSCSQKTIELSPKKISVYKDLSIPLGVQDQVLSRGEFATPNVISPKLIPISKKIESSNPISTSPVQPESYIIIFKDKPLIEKRAEITKETNYILNSPTKKLFSPSEKRLIEDRVTLELNKVKEFKKTKVSELKKQGIETGESSNIITNTLEIKASHDQVKNLENDPQISKIIPNEKVHLFLDESVPYIHVPEVWNELDSQGRQITGKDIKIAIIDTGVDYTHPDLGGCFGTGCKVVGGYDFINNDSDPMDDHFHGTHVAATAAGNGTLKGVAPDAQIYAFKVLNSQGSGTLSELLMAYDSLIDLNSNGIPLEDDEDFVDIFSMSLGFTGGNSDSEISLATDSLIDLGLVGVIAAGNNGAYGQYTVGSPGTSRKAITIGAMNISDENIASFSSRGPVLNENDTLIKPDILAPGVNICAAKYHGVDVDPAYYCLDQEHISISGTSMATPHISGLVALMLQAHPDWNPSMIKSSLLSSTIDLGLKGTTQGTGLVNAVKAVDVNSTRSKILNGKLEFGSVRSTENTTITKDITILNPSDIDRTYSLSTPFNVSKGSLSFPQQVFVPKFTNRTIQINLTTVEGIDEQLYEDNIYISNNFNENFTVPLLFSSLSKVSVKVIFPMNYSMWWIGVFILDSATKEHLSGFMFHQIINETETEYSSTVNMIGLNSSINYDFVFVGHADWLISSFNDSNQTLNSFYGCKRPVNFITNIDLKLNKTVTANISNWNINLSYDPYNEKREPLNQQNEFSSSFGVSLPNGGIMNFPVDMNTYYHYGETDEKVKMKCSFLSNKIPGDYILDYSAFSHLNQDIYYLTDRIVTPNESKIFSNNYSEIIKKEFYFPLLNEEYNFSTLSPLYGYYAGFTSPEKYNIGRTYVSLYYPPYNIYNISLNLPLNIHINARKDKDNLFGELVFNLLNASNPIKLVGPGAAVWGDPLIKFDSIINVSSDNTIFHANARSPFPQKYLPREAITNTNNKNVDTPPLFFSNLYYPSKSNLRFNSFILSQSGDILTFGGMYIFFKIYQNGNLIEEYIPGTIPNEILFEKNSSLYTIYPSLNTLSLNQPIIVEQSLAPFLMGNFKWTQYNTTSKFSINPSIANSEPPTLIDLDILLDNTPATSLSIPNGSFSFTIADDNLITVNLTINGQDIPLIEFGDPYSVSPPENILEETQASGFIANLSDFINPGPGEYDAVIKAYDLDGNWMEDKIILPITDSLITNINEGINFISTPLNNTQTACDSNIKIVTYKNESWDFYTPYEGEIYDFNKLQGYILITDKDYRHAFYGDLDENNLMSLNEGWNLIGVPRSDTLTNLYDPTYTAFEWTGSDFQDVSNQVLIPGIAYWVYPGTPLESPPRFNS